MRFLRFSLTAFALMFAAHLPPPAAHAQVAIGINVGPAPACPYGYYGYAPYRCAPYGYYGPEWFAGGGFIGAGPWYRSGPRFYGHVNRAYDPRFGYRGGYPQRGPYDGGRDWHDFHGTHYSDERGHYHTEAQHGRYERH